MSSGGRSHTAPPHGRPQAGQPAAPGRDEGERRTDRDGHRLRLPLGDRSPRRPASTSSSSATPPPMVVLGYPGTELVSMEEMVDARQGRAPRPEDAADGRRHADGQLRGEQRAGDPERPAPGQGDRLPGGQARGRRRHRRARPGDRQLRHPGDGPRRPHPADRDRPRRLQSPGQDRQERDQAAARTPSPCSRSAASRSSSRPSRRRSPRRSSRSSRCRRSASAPAPATSGQVLVFHDLLGITTGHMAKFVKRYADVHETMVAARRASTATRSAAATSPSPTTSTASSRPSSTSSAATSDQESLASPRPGSGSRCPERQRRSLPRGGSRGWPGGRRWRGRGWRGSGGR